MTLDDYFSALSTLDFRLNFIETTAYPHHYRVAFCRTHDAFQVIHSQAPTLREALATVLARARAGDVFDARPKWKDEYDPDLSTVSVAPMVDLTALMAPRLVRR